MQKKCTMAWSMAEGHRETDTPPRPHPRAEIACHGTTMARIAASFAEFDRSMQFPCLVQRGRRREVAGGCGKLRRRVVIRHTAIPL